MNELIIKILSIERIDNIYEYDTLLDNLSIYEKKVLYNNDGSFKAINVESNIFVNVKNEDLNKEASKELKKLIGNSYIIAENGYKINIDKKFIKEFLYSKSSQSINKSKFLIKLTFINYINEILINSYDKKWEISSKEKHKIDAKYGFYRYKIKLQIIVNGSKETFIASPLIRNDTNGKKYLYDILNIKKID